MVLLSIQLMAREKHPTKKKLKAYLLLIGGGGVLLLIFMLMDIIASLPNYYYSVTIGGCTAGILIIFGSLYVGLKLERAVRRLLGKK